MTIRLVPAIAVKEALEKQYAHAVAHDPGRMIWYRTGNGSPWLVTVDENDWYRVQRAAMDGDDVIGYVAASIDRECNIVTELSVVRLADKPSPTFIAKVRSFVHWLRMQFDYIRFSSLRGNPARPRWSRFAERLGGGEIGVFESDVKLEDGRIVDRFWYGIPGRGRTG